MPNTPTPNRKARRAAKALRRTALQPRTAETRVVPRPAHRPKPQTQGGRPHLFPGRTGGR